MSNYTKWTYGNSWLDENTKQGIYKLFQDGSEDLIKAYLSWLHTNEQDFLFSKRDVIFSYLVDCSRFGIADEFTSTKPFLFSEKIAICSATFICLEFKLDTFDYWLGKVDSLSAADQSQVTRKFWEEFLAYQFMRTEEFDSNISNLEPAMKGAAFYSDSELGNMYKIQYREKFFNEKIDRLQDSQKQELLEQIGVLCGQYYPGYEKEINEEFIKHPVVIDTFIKSKMMHSLDNRLEEKKNTSKIKI